MMTDKIKENPTNLKFYSWGHHNGEIYAWKDTSSMPVLTQDTSSMPVLTQLLNDILTCFISTISRVIKERSYYLDIRAGIPVHAFYWAMEVDQVPESRIISLIKLNIQLLQQVNTP